MNTVHAMFLFQGFAAAGANFSDTGMGQIDAAHAIAPWADAIGDCWEYLSDIQDFPGVFDYEVTEPFGQWLRANWDAPFPEAIGQLLDLIKQFFRDTVLSQDALSHLRHLIEAHII